MKRIEIRYGSELYSVGDRPLADVVAEIERGIASAGPAWLRVNDGEGFPRDARLLLTPGVPIVVIPMPDPEEASEGVVSRD